MIWHGLLKIAAVCKEAGFIIHTATGCQVVDGISQHFNNCIDSQQAAHGATVRCIIVTLL